MNDVVKIVADYYGVPVMFIHSEMRKHDVAYARHVCIFIFRDVFKLKLAEIGRMLNRNHATMQHSHSTIQQQLEVDKKLQTDIAIIKRLIKRKKVSGLRFCRQTVFKIERIAC